MIKPFELSPEMYAVMSELNWPPIRAGHRISGQSRIVHDLGIIGDDWDDFYEALRRHYGKDFEIPNECMPGEITHDSAMVASAVGWIARKVPRLQEWYISRLRCEPLTLSELHCIIVGA